MKITFEGPDYEPVRDAVQALLAFFDTPSIPDGPTLAFEASQELLEILKLYPRHLAEVANENLQPS